MKGNALQNLVSEPGEWFEPVTFLYRVQTPFGVATQHLTLNLWQMPGEVETVEAMGGLLWREFVRPLTSATCWLSSYQTMRWHANFPSVTVLPQPLLGAVPSVPAPLEQSIGWMLGGELVDRLGRRGFYFPGTPSGWVEDGRITEVGLRRHMEAARIGVMALMNRAVGGPYDWLIHKVGAVDPTVTNFYGVGFRIVTHVYVLDYSVRANHLGDVLTS